MIHFVMHLLRGIGCAKLLVGAQGGQFCFAYLFLIKLQNKLISYSEFQKIQTFSIHPVSANKRSKMKVGAAVSAHNPLLSALVWH